MSQLSCDTVSSDSGTLDIISPVAWSGKEFDVSVLDLKRARAKLIADGAKSAVSASWASSTARDTSTGSVSILITIGVGRLPGSSPRAKTSMTNVLPPQHGHGRARTLG